MISKFVDSNLPYLSIEKKKKTD